MTNNTDIQLVRLQKFLARAGVASRRASEDLIVSGRVTVNGQIADTLGTKVNPDIDIVAVDGQVIDGQDATVTLMLHKPAGYVTTMSDPQGRPTVAELVPVDRYPGLFPVGRLDRDTTGLLLFSTDGDLGARLLHPGFHVNKTYVAMVDGVPDEADLENLRNGVALDDGMTAPAIVTLLSGEEEATAREQIGSDAQASGLLHAHSGVNSRAQREKSGSIVSITIHEGRKRQVRRMFSALSHPVIALHRQSFDELTLDGLDRGCWRLLTQAEVETLFAHSGLEHDEAIHG